MAAHVEALVNADVLAWARLKAGLSPEEAARRTAVAASKLISWEQATERPTITQARKLASVYRRPLALFYLSEPPDDFMPMLHDFRRLPGSGEGLDRSNLTFEIRRALERRSIALELIELSGSSAALMPEIDASISDPDLFADTLRQRLAISLDEQVNWRTPYEALNVWKTSVEAQGILVFQASRVDMTEMRGISINQKPLPIIILNSADAPNGRIFTILHELAHILLNESGLCDMREGSGVNAEDNAKEVFCNRVAGTVLVPTRTLLSDRIVSSNRGPVWTDEAISALSRRYSISREVVLRRLLILGKTDNAFYEDKVDQYYQEFLQSKKEREGFAPPYVQALSQAGTYFANLVLENYHKERITSADVSEYLGIRLKHLQRVEQALASKSVLEN
ncbi:MAG: XRE family transcriptional regulator [Spirochaetia bacterium]|jgi:Zn-dependent peptidase ImmA (M78 family)/transcriptional regulator with XRE-family HTH domain